ncbi:MAG: acetyl-CoA acetyltransferase [Myxococcota bacterium]
MARSIRGKVAIAGVGESTYYKRGQAKEPEYVLTLQAILAACRDAGIDPRAVDGFASFSNDQNDPARIAASLGLPELRYANMVFGGGGGGGSAAVANAASAIAAGYADCVVVYRGLAQGQGYRFGQGHYPARVSGGMAYMAPYGVLSPAQMFAFRTTRLMHEHGIARSTLRAVAMASYHHAQANPRAVMRGRPLDEAGYDAARWIVEPFGLFDCCLENDGAAAMILVPAECAKDLRQPPVYLLGAAQGSGYRDGASVQNHPDMATSSFKTLAPRLYAMAGVGPADVDVVQSYENFTGGVVMSLIEHGFCTYENANALLTFENLIAPKGRLPLNTSGGNLAECYMHGLELNVEAVRQIRGQSTSQVPGAEVALVNSGPMVPLASNMIVGGPSTV